MKYLFATTLAILVLCSIGLRLSYPDAQTEVPVIYWVTDKNPAREEQVATFEQWLIKHGHVDETGRPVVELRLDMANRDMMKQTIQSVSGVGGDLMDTDGAAMHLFQAMGVIRDVTEDGLAMGFDPSQTYEAIRPEITIDGRQYRYPANVGNSMLWVNVDVFRRFGLEPPPLRWTWEQFERRGIEFVTAANPPGTPAWDRRFFAADLDIVKMYRSTGLSTFNETLTACILNDPRYAQTLETKKRWIYDINILPTPDDQAAYATSQGYGGANSQLFGRGNYAMLEAGRWMLIQFRRFENIQELAVVEPPHESFPNTLIGSRAVVLYTGSPNPELAKLFLAYLASEDYNLQIVKDADALPPNPKYTRSEAFLNPPDFPREHGVHGVFLEAAETIAIAGVYSPYVLPTVLQEERVYYEGSFMNDQMSAQEAADKTAAMVNDKMAAEIARKPDLAEAYARDAALQEKIDALKAQGKPIPVAWVKNPFYVAYYRRTGQLLEEQASQTNSGPNAAAETSAGGGAS